MSIHLESIFEKCKSIATGVLLIIAPTGTGKTMGMRDLILQHRQVYGKTIMVQPTRMAGCLIDLPTKTPLQMIHHFLQKKKFDCDTLVLDEIHSVCVEYHTLLSILQKTESYKSMRVILMSATVDPYQLQQYFPLTIYEACVSSPYSIQVHYEPLEFPTFPPYRQMMRHVVDVLKKYPRHQRVLVFLYTHDQCDKMALELKTFATTYHQGKTFALYGGMDENDMMEWQKFLQEEKCFIIFATNVAETSITIPDLSLVIDFGVRCIQRNNRIVYNYCPQMNLIQRTGRTGRTCCGTVIRCMTEQDFETRPRQDNPEYYWDMMVLLMLRYKYKPSTLLPIDPNNILNKFRFYGLLKNNVLNHEIVSFVLRCPLLLKNSCQLFHFLKTYGNHPDLVLFILSTTLIDQTESKMSRLYYYSYEMKIGRYKLLEKLKKVFANKNDELILYINILVSCMLNEKPVLFSNAFSLNFRTLRQIASAMTRLWNFICDKNKIQPWQEVLRKKMETKITWDLERRSKYSIMQLKQDHGETLRHFYLMNPLTPKFMVINDLIWRPNFIVEYYHCIFSPFAQVYQRNRCILILSYDDSEIHHWFDPSIPLTSITTLSFSIYTYPPSRIDFFIQSLEQHVKVSHFQMSSFRKKKELVRKKFQGVVQEIEEDVAYRPGFWKMYDMINGFLKQLDHYSPSKKLHDQ